MTQMLYSPCATTRNPLSVRGLPLGARQPLARAGAVPRRAHPGCVVPRRRAGSVGCLGARCGPASAAVRGAVRVRRPVRRRAERTAIVDRPGRIPGARNAPWAEELPELPAGELVVYCGSGVTACVVLHRASLDGREGKLYPGSWSEWSKRGLPIERG